MRCCFWHAWVSEWASSAKWLLGANTAYRPNITDVLFCYALICTKCLTGEDTARNTTSRPRQLVSFWHPVLLLELAWLMSVTSKHRADASKLASHQHPKLWPVCYEQSTRNLFCIKTIWVKPWPQTISGSRFTWPLLSETETTRRIPETTRRTLTYICTDYNDSVRSVVSTVIFRLPRWQANVNDDMMYNW